MLFHKEKLLALFLVPKTGTTSANDFLKKFGWQSIMPEHQTPEYFVKCYPNLNKYQFFAYIRDPLKRFESTILYLKSIDVTDVIDLTYDECVNNFERLFKNDMSLFHPQVRWFRDSRVQALDFDNYESELRKISGVADTSSYEIQKLNNTSFVEKGVVTQKVIDFVRSYYAEDYALARNRLGKEY